MNKLILLSTDRDLEDFVSRNCDANRLAIDTEFVRERTFFPCLCLVQLVIGDELVCVDTLKIRSLTPLADLFFATDCLKILHAGKQDLEVLYQALGHVPAPLFDTQIAAGFCGFGDQIGYADLARALCDVQLEKAHTRFNWKKRPLPEKVLAYAADDVRYLLPIYDKLRANLDELERASWQDAESGLLTNPELYNQPVETAWTRVRGMARLSDPQWLVAGALAAWREKTARQEDRPRQWIMRDESLLDIAQCDTVTIDSLTAIKGVPKQYVAELTQVVQQAHSGTPQHREPLPARLSNRQRTLVGQLLEITRARGVELNITPSTLATRRDIENLVRGESNLPLHSGWRKKIIGDQLIDLLAGA